MGSWLFSSSFSHSLSAPSAVGSIDLHLLYLDLVLFLS